MMFKLRNDNSGVPTRRAYAMLAWVVLALLPANLASGAELVTQPSVVFAEAPATYTPGSGQAIRLSVGGTIDSVLVQVFDANWRLVKTSVHTLRGEPWTLDNAKLDLLPEGAVKIQVVGKVKNKFLWGTKVNHEMTVVVPVPEAPPGPSVSYVNPPTTYTRGSNSSIALSVEGEIDSVLVQMFDANWQVVKSTVHTLTAAPWTIDSAKLDLLPAGAATVQVVGKYKNKTLWDTKINHSLKVELPPAPEPQPTAKITVLGLSAGATVKGALYVQAAVDVAVDSVTFTIPDAYQHTEKSAPYAMASDNRGTLNPFDTTTLPDGNYTLTVTAALKSGGTATQIMAFTVKNQQTATDTQDKTTTTDPTQDTTTTDVAQDTTTDTPTADTTPVTLLVKGVSSGQTVSGDLYIEATVDQAVASVTFNIPGVLNHMEKTAPYGMMSDSGGILNPWDTTNVSNGDYKLTVTATQADGSTTIKTVSFKVSNDVVTELEPSTGTDVTTGDAAVAVPGYPGVAGAGVSQNAIARWDVVPEQSFTGKFEIGVAAYHLGGIDRVEFVVNGQTTVAVRQRSVNPRTNVAEYWMTLDGSALPAGWVTVSATAYPTKGLARELPEIRLYNGEPNWQVIELGAGTHLLSDLPIVSEGWLTIRPKAGVSRDAVDVVVAYRSDSGSVIQRQGHVHFENLRIRGNDAKGLFYGRDSGSMLWYDKCILDGEGRTWKPYQSTTAYLTDTEIKGFQVASDGNTELIRGVSVYDNYEDVFRNPRFIANTRVWNVDRGNTAGHPDLLEIQPFKCSNIIIQNLTADRIAGQGLYSSNVSDMAVVDSYINTSESGEPWIAAHFLGEHRNVLIHRSTFVGSARFRTDKTPPFAAYDFVWSNSSGGSVAPYVPTPYLIAGVTYLGLPLQD